MPTPNRLRRLIPLYDIKDKIGYGGFCVDARIVEYVGGPMKSRKL